MNDIELVFLEFIYSLHTPAADMFFTTVTRLGNYGIIWILSVVMLTAYKGTRLRGMTSAAALAFDGIICYVIKIIIMRTRPFNVNTMIPLLISAPTDYSFPSGHTGASFAVTAALFLTMSVPEDADSSPLIVRRPQIISAVSLILALLMAFSRLYLFVHYPTDVFAGIVIGILCGYLGKAAADAAIKRKNKE